MRNRPDRLFLLTGAAQGFGFSWGLAAVVWWVVELELSPLRLVLLGSALELTILLTEVPTGVLADIWSRKWSVTLAYALMGMAMMLAPITPYFPALLAWQAMFAIGWTLQSGAATAWVTDESATSADTLIVKHAKWRVIGLLVGLPATAAIGVWSVTLAMAAVGLVSVAFAGLLMFAMSETRRFATHAAHAEDESKAADAGAPADVTAAASDVTVPDVPAAAPDVPVAVPAPIPPTPPNVAHNVARTRLSHRAIHTALVGARLVRRQRILMIVLISTAAMGAANQAIDSLDLLRVTNLGLPEFGLFENGQSGNDSAESIVFFGVIWYVMSALQLPLVAWLGRHVDSMSTWRATHFLRLLLGTASLGVLALAVGPWLPLAIGGWVLREVTTELTFPLAETIANRQEDSSVRATVVSFLGQAESLGQVVGGTALGVVAQLATVPWALVGASVLLMLGALVYLFAGRPEPTTGAAN